jgi:hypothetical protein
MVMAMETAKATTWVMVMVKRMAGNKEGKGKGGKGDGDDDEGGMRAIVIGHGLMAGNIAC